MLMRFPLWKTLLILGILAVGVFLSLPNILPENLRASYPSQALKLGLDLRGGASILLEIDRNDLLTNRLRELSSDASQTFRQQPRVAVLPRNKEVKDGVLRIKPSEPSDVPEAIKRLKKLGDPPAGTIGGVNSLTVSEEPNGWISVKLTDAALEKLRADALNQSIEAVRRRIDNAGTVEPNIQRQGDNRVVVEVPGLEDPAPLVDVLTQAGVLTFNMVDVEANPADYTAGEERNGRIALPNKSRGGALDVIFADPVISGNDLQTATQGFDQFGQPNVAFQLRPAGAQRFGRVTTENVKKPFAIVLDNQIISAPTIQNPITTGNGQITGVGDVQEANNLAIILRSGALPAKLQVVEQRQVGAGLGADSIRMGVTATLVGFVLVVLFMLVVYGLLGVFAILALAANVVLLIGVLSGLGATLTLPGIGGIVLTLGMAVDANVLIYERIREEQHGGRSAVSSAESGFKFAMATIYDSHITQFLAALILFIIGTGSVRGFAVTLSIGIITSVFTAVWVTRLIMSGWLFSAKPKAIPI